MNNEMNNEKSYSEKSLSYHVEIKREKHIT